MTSLYKKVVGPTVSPYWAPDSCIYFKVVSDGMSREAWKQRLELRGRRITDRASSILDRMNDAPTLDVTYNVGILMGKKIHPACRSLDLIFKEGVCKEWKAIPCEAAFLICDTFVDKVLALHMGVDNLFLMHEPVKDSCGEPRQLYMNHGYDGYYLKAQSVRAIPFNTESHGFAFIESRLPA